ncbi:hypothetical protein B0H17DRAFT_939230 [Mycena rosella]|uniref:Uncharacterized protein n=1 Tax=Mycena rosella TaxID=1033263 RepID=A0AAD7DBC0_MYCRO|nr:hypothetical protein B0H17DRAFT_939230 [Mycena rosella]
MSETSHKLTFTRLNEKNYGTWTGDKRAELQRLGVWLIVKGAIIAPISNDPEELCKWLVDSGKTAGSIYASINSSQQVHVKWMEEHPVAMWNMLERVHRQKKPGARFPAYNTLFFIRKEPEEMLTQLIGRVENTVSLIKDLRPPGHTLDNLDGELTSMAMIRALPKDFKAFRSSLFLLPQLDKATITEAFLLEESDRQEQAAKDAELSMALKAVALTTASVSAQEFCDWCKRIGHLTRDC